MRISRRVVSLLLVMVLALSLGMTAFAAGLGQSSLADAPISVEKKTRTGLVTLTLGIAGKDLSAEDWAKLKNNGVPFELNYTQSYFRFRPADVSASMNSETLDLSGAQVPADLIAEIEAETGLQEGEYMLYLPSSLGTLPGMGTVGICLSREFIEVNGYQNLNIYGVDFLRRTQYNTPEDEDGNALEDGEKVADTYYMIRSIGQAASGVSGEKSYAPWVTFRSSVSRLLIITKKNLTTFGSMSWNRTEGSVKASDEVLVPSESNTRAESDDSNYIPSQAAATGDANPNTGAAGVSAALFCGITALGAASVVTLARALRHRNGRS